LRLLLDTHAALWWLSADERFSPQAERVLTDGTNQVLLSAAVVWEVAIKRSLGKLRAPPDLAPTLLGAGVQALPVTLDHAAHVEQLAWHQGVVGRLISYPVSGRQESSFGMPGAGMGFRSGRSRCAPARRRRGCRQSSAARRIPASARCADCCS